MSAKSTESTNVLPVLQRNKFKKPVDSTAFSATFERAVRYLYSRDSGDGGLEAIAVYLVDPYQVGQNTLKPLTVLGAQGSGGDPLGGAGNYLLAQPIVTLRFGNPGGTGNSFVTGAQWANQVFQQVSAANTSQNIVIDIRQAAQILAIVSTASGGTATLTIEVSSSVDGTSNFITVDSIAAALVNAKNYTGATTGATTAISPLAFRWIRITAGAAGIGFTTTLSIGIK